jgi:hypothetical protein
MSPTTKSRWLKLAGIVVAYALALATSVAVLVFDVGHDKALPIAAKIPIALAPLLPALLVVPWVIGNFRLMDEMQVRHQLEAIVAAAAATAFLTLGYALLEIIGFPRLPMAIVWCTMMGLWISATWIQRWRFR